MIGGYFSTPYIVNEAFRVQTPHRWNAMAGEEGEVRTIRNG